MLSKDAEARLRSQVEHCGLKPGNRLLLQVDSMEPSDDMNWWDNGKLAFFIPSERASPTDFQGSTAIVVGSG